MSKQAAPKKSAGGSFKDTVSACRAMLSDIAARRYALVYLLMGEEGFFIDKVADALAEGVLKPEEKAFNQIVAYGKDSEAGAIINFARQMPMMGGHQVVIVREAQQLRGIEGLDVYVRQPSPTTILVLCHKDKSVDKRSALYKQAKANGVVLESVRPRDYEIGPWLADFAREKGLEFEPQALGMVVDHLGTDISKISNELDKLITSLPVGTTRITAAHVEQNIGINKEFNNFELTRALSEGNMARAMMIGEQLSHDPNPMWLGITLSTMFSHFQRIFVLGYQQWLARRRGASMPNDYELSRMLKLPTPFFLNEYKAALGRFPNRKTFAILGWIREYDMRSKGFGGGSASRGELLRELLLKIFAA